MSWADLIVLAGDVSVEEACNAYTPYLTDADTTNEKQTMHVTHRHARTHKVSGGELQLAFCGGRTDAGCSCSSA